MKERVYLLIDVVEGRERQVLMALRGQPGIVLADRVEGPPDIVVIAEAQDRQSLANLIVQAIASIENLTNNIQFLPVCGGRKLSMQSRKASEQSNLG